MTLSRATWLLIAWCVLAVGAVEAREPWVVLKDCRLLPNESNDGDSFHVKAGNKEYIFRLYFADAPETDDEFADRVAEQAKYFGVTVPQVVQLGGFAKKFADEKLARPFTVRTCMQDAMGRSHRERFYAFIETHDGDLAELLVANGLARVHGSAATPVGLTSPEREWQKLQRLEREAKVTKVGGWGATAGRMTARSATQPSKSGADSFTAFFHPEQVATGTPASSAGGGTLPGTTPAAQSNWPFPTMSATPATTRTSQSPDWPFPSASAMPTGEAPGGHAKLDVNSAPAAELQNVRGIGPVLAQRIIEARPYKSADELRRVKGIGAKTYEKLRPFFL